MALVSVRAFSSFARNGLEIQTIVKNLNDKGIIWSSKEESCLDWIFNLIILFFLLSLMVFLMVCSFVH